MFALLHILDPFMLIFSLLLSSPHPAGPFPFFSTHYYHPGPTGHLGAWDSWASLLLSPLRGRQTSQPVSTKLE